MYDLKQIEKTFKQKSWWAMIVDLLPAKYITFYLANRSKVSPNQITLLSFIFAVFAGVSFFYNSYISGAVLYQISYILDIVDGSLARVKNLSSKLGAFFDVFTDWLKGPLLIIVLFLKFNYINELIIILYLLFLTALANKYNDRIFYTEKKSIINSSNMEQESVIYKYFNFMQRKNINPLPGMVEFEALLLFFLPIFQEKIFVYLSIVLLVFLFTLKIFLIYKKIK